MADRRKSPRLVIHNNGKEEATDDNENEDAADVLSRVDGCLAANTVLDLTLSASGLNPNADPFLLGNRSNTVPRTVADHGECVVAEGDDVVSDEEDCALPVVNGLTSRVIVGWPDGGLNKVNGTKAGWGYTLCEQVLENGELVMKLIEDGCGPVIEKHHPEWMQRYFLGSTDQSPGQAEFCGTIEMLKGMHGLARKNPDHHFTFTGRPDSQNVIDTICCRKISSNRLLLEQALSDRDALLLLDNVSENSFDLFHSKAHLTAGQFKCPFNHRADRNAAQGALGRIQPAGRWANVVQELED